MIIVAYHGAGTVAAAIDALDPDEDVTVVDNSADGDVRRVAESRGVRYVDSGGNLGYSGGVRAGVDALGGTSTLETDLLLLNQDAFLSSASLDTLQAALAAPGNERVGVVAPGVRHPDGGAPGRVRWPFPTPGRQWLLAAGLSRLVRGDEFSIGCALLLRREAVQQLGVLDDRYFLYSEETDWQQRAARAGWSSLFVPQVEVRHIGGVTSSDERRRETLQQAGQETYIRRWHGRAGWFSYRAATVVGWGVRGLLRPGPAGAEARFLARLYLDGPRKRAASAGCIVHPLRPR